jgi:hypothetical protein
LDFSLQNYKKANFWPEVQHFVLAAPENEYKYAKFIFIPTLARIERC